MELKLRPREECTFDAVSLGEVMLRLDPGEGRIRTARTFSAWEGGGEYNVIRGLHKCFGMKTAVITAFADNEVGMLMKDFIEQGGVSTDLIYWKKTDGIGRICRNGINFTERGFGIRGAVGCSDRANTAISQATPEDFDFEYIFGKLGVRWLHTGGIYAALSEQACETVIAACKTAKKYGTFISYDLNYRPSMWSAIGGLAKCREVNREVAKYVDVMIGNEEDLQEDDRQGGRDLSELQGRGDHAQNREDRDGQRLEGHLLGRRRDLPVQGIQRSGDPGSRRRRRLLCFRSGLRPHHHGRRFEGGQLRRCPRRACNDDAGRHLHGQPQRG